LDIYGQGSTPVARDLRTNPLTEGEVQGAKIGQNLLGALPFGSLINQAIDYNMGKDASSNPNLASANTIAPDTLGGRAGFYSGLGNSLSDSMRGSIADSGLGKFGGMQRPPGLIGAGQVDHFGTYYGGQGFRGVGGVGYDLTPATSAAQRGETYGPTMPDGEPLVLTGGDGVMSSSNQHYGENYGNDSYSMGPPSSGSWQDSPGFSGMGPASPGSFGAGYADGGIVGMTGPMHDGANRSATTLTQLGFADGGRVGAMGAQGSPEMIQEQVSRMVRDPGFQQVAQRAVGGAIQSGELTPEELVTLGRIAEAAMHNPQLYPQLRKFAMQNGMTPLPDAFDPRLVTVLIASAQVMGRTAPGQVPPTDVAQMQNPNGQDNGGFLRGPGTGRSDSIGTVEESTGKPVKVANGEYVIPKHVVDAKGKDFFDKMLRQYAQLTPQE
jgi:hypothetical protein